MIVSTLLEHCLPKHRILQDNTVPLVNKFRYMLAYNLAIGVNKHVVDKYSALIDNAMSGSDYNDLSAENRAIILELLTLCNQAQDYATTAIDVSDSQAFTYTDLHCFQALVETFIRHGDDFEWGIKHIPTLTAYAAGEFLKEEVPAEVFKDYVALFINLCKAVPVSDPMLH